MNTIRLWIAVPAAGVAPHFGSRKPGPDSHFGNGNRNANPAPTRKAVAMSSLARHFCTMAANNAWANHRLLTACAHLSQQEFTATRTSFFPSLKATLNHIVTVDWYYVDALERACASQPVNADARGFFDPQEPFATCAEIMAAQHAVDARLIETCRKLTDTQLELPVALLRRAGVQHETAARLLAHLFQHQIHHRGQAHAMLAGTSVAPPPLDEFFCANEAHLRAAELAELGLSEEMIWK